MLIRSLLIMIALTATASAQEDIFAGTEDVAGAPNDASTEKPLIAAALATGELTTFVAIVKAALLTGELDSRRPLTVLAPTDEAFDRLPEGTITSLLKPKSRDQLVALIKNHVVRSTFPEDKLKKTKKLKTMQGETWAPEINDEDLIINDAKILKSDIPFHKGVLHIVDTVMVPKK